MVDGTHPNGFNQILIILYKDKIINEKISECFIITNNKKYDIYFEALNSFKNIVTQKGIFDFNLKTISIDNDLSLFNGIINVLPNIKIFFVTFIINKI